MADSSCWWTKVAIFLVCGLLGSLSGFGQDTQPSLNRSKLAWSELELEAKKLFLTARTHLIISNSKMEERNSKVSANELCGLGPEKEPLCLELHSDLLGRHSQTRMWFSAMTGTGLRSLRLETGKRNRFKDYEFVGKGVHVFRRNPVKGEEGLSPGRWSEVSQEFLAYPDPGKLGCRLTDPAVLLYAASVGDLFRAGDEIALFVLSKGHFFRVVLAHGGRCEVGVDYIQVKGGAEEKVHGQQKAHRILVKPNPWSGTQEGKAFSMLGLQGELELFVDEKTRVPLLVTGEIKLIGDVKIQLRRAVLTHP